MESLRLRNQVLSTALQEIHDTAQKEAQKHYDLVWFARNRGRFPNHEARKRIEDTYPQDLAKLQTLDADHFHGIHCGLLAAARMYASHADVVLRVNEHEQVTTELLQANEEHQKRMEQAQEAYPHVTVDEFPKGP